MEGRQAKEGAEQPAVPGAGGAEQQEKKRREQVALVHFGGEEVHRQHDDAGHGKKGSLLPALPVQDPGKAHGQHRRSRRQHPGDPSGQGVHGIPVQAQKPIEVIGVDGEVIVVAHGVHILLDEPTEIPALGIGQGQQKNQRKGTNQPQGQPFPVLPLEHEEQEHRSEQEHLGLHEHAKAVEGPGGGQPARLFPEKQQHGPQ